MVRAQRKLGPRKGRGQRGAGSPKQGERNRADALDALRATRSCDPYQALVLLETAEAGGKALELILAAVGAGGRKW